LRQRFLQSGLDGFLDYEIIELLLTLGTPRKDCKQPAKEAINKLKGLTGVLDSSFSELEQIKGIGRNSSGVEINDSGWIAGSSQYIQGNIAEHAFIWTKENGMIDIGVLAGMDTIVQDMNNAGQIVGALYDSQGNRHIALWEPIDMPTHSISGAVALQNYTGDATQVPILVEIRKQDGDTTSLTIYPQSDSSFVFEDLTIGTYDIAFKASHWLQTTVLDVAVFSDVTDLDVSLVNGDVDGDNDVDRQDAISLLRAGFTNPTSPRWNPNADLNGDDRVNRKDAQILRANLGTIGDE